MSSLNSTHTCRNNSLEEEPDYEDPIEIKVLRKQRGDFMHGIIPSQIVPHLTCLTRADESCILAATSRKGDIEGAGVLLYHLMTKKDVWYEDLLKALRNNDVKLEHLATSLENEVKKRKEEVYDIEMTCEDSYSESYDTGNLESPPSQNCNQVYACHIITESGTKSGIKTELHVPGVPDYPPPPYSKVEHGYDQALSVDNEGCHGDVIKQDGGNIQSKRVYESEETAKESLEKEVISPAAESTPVGTSESQTRHVINYEVLKPRGYQEELAGPACKGLNSIICAPAGTGKTHVAMMVSKNHMHRAMEVQAAGNSSTSKGKILLTVHMTPLLNQTYKRFKTYLPLFKTGKISGVTTSKLTFEHLAKINDIVITTAGFFENILEKKTTSISAFSLIILYECDHAMKNHPYNRIMREYLKIKLAGCSAQLPQIVGLTASPVTVGKSHLQAAQTHLLKLCANLDAQTFVTVQNPDNKVELEKYVSIPDKFTTIAATRSPDPFQDRIAEIMAEIEHKTGDIETCPQRGTEEYEQFIITTRNETLNGNKHETVQCCEHLIQYNKALQISSMCRMSDGLKIIDGFYNERWQRGQHETTSIEKYLYKLFRRNSSELFDISEDENKYPNPKVLKLKENLAEEIKKMDEELRGIIFVKTRALARAIYECIVDDKTLKSLKPAILVGVKSTGVECMTQAEQDTRLRKFALGHCKLLVATSVAEEGLDIKECHMLIRYNYSTNVISLRQSSGRARALESTEHFIGDEDLATRDSVNVFLDQQMEKAIDLIQDMPQAQLQGTVRHTQMNDIAEVYEKESKHIPVKFKSNSVKLYCTGCGKYVCNGNDVYIYDESSHIIVDKAIIKNIATIMTTRSVMLG